ncbi:MAG: SOS response-associated peptidase family protein [Chitinophagaceae bacterium]
MCYDISFKSSFELLSDYLPGLIVEPGMQLDIDMNMHVLAQAYRKFPIIIEDNGTYKLKMFEWGLIADYMNTPEKIKKSRSFMCNIRSEKILGDKSSVWYRIRRNRCLIPVSGIFEHREIKRWKNKVPYYVTLNERPMFCIPGLFNYSPVPDVETGELTGTFALITRAANSVMKQIHNGGENAFRMPLFLRKELELKWLDSSSPDDELAKILDFEMPSEELQYHPVFTIRTTKTHPLGKSKTDFFEWPGLPELGNDEGIVNKTLF